jgi:transcriptional regulator
MYIPKNIEIQDVSVAHDLIDEFGFGVVVSSSLTGTHIPLVLHRDEGELGVLYSHFAKANPHWKELEGKEVLIIFSGPHSYISPSWYASSPAVPTWNYAAVHAVGKVTLLSGAQTLAVVEEVVRQYEPELLISKNIITNAYRDKLLSGIVGFKVEVSQLDSKLKLGQQRPIGDQVGVYNALNHASSAEALGLAKYMRKHSLGMGADTDS